MSSGLCRSNERVALQLSVYFTTKHQDELCHLCKSSRSGVPRLQLFAYVTLSFEYKRLVCTFKTSRWFVKLCAHYSVLSWFSRLRNLLEVQKVLFFFLLCFPYMKVLQTSFTLSLCSRFRLVESAYICTSSALKSLNSEVRDWTLNWMEFK